MLKFNDLVLSCKDDFMFSDNRTATDSAYSDFLMISLLALADSVIIIVIV